MWLATSVTVELRSFTRSGSVTPLWLTHLSDLPPLSGGFFPLCSLCVLAVFTVDNSPLYFVAHLDEDGQECYGPRFTTREEAEAFASNFDNRYVVLRSPLNY